ncbi:MAG: UDP-glucose 4-epimerase GalE [Spirochaetales bacterium]|jgi:UDP-glucose 4-epimerase|nr:UDP-glucose 4-epimerase GalE [Spirochaetales bacterium]
MKVLVCGGAGYIGSHVVKALLRGGFEVTVFDNFSTGLEENLQGGAGLIRGDILDPGALEAAFAGGGEGSGPFEGVVHLAALKAAGDSMTNPEAYSLSNIGGTVNLLRACSAGGVKYFVFSSTAAVYGAPVCLPVEENHPLNPENFYGFTKKIIEDLLTWYDLLRGLKFAVLRYFNAAGYDPEGSIRGREKNPANLFPVIMEAAAGLREEVLIFGDDYDTPDGTGVRDYVHPWDLAQAHLQALEYLNQENRSLCLNLGSERGFSVKEILTAARRITGRIIPARVVPRRPGDSPILVASAHQARRVLDWTPHYSDLDSLIKTAWEVYRPD